MLRVAETPGRLERLRRDVRTIVGDFFGRKPPPFLVRSPLPRHEMSVPSPDAAAAALWLTPRSLLVEKVVRETHDTTSFHLMDPSGAAIAFAPGQFLTVLVPLPNGATLRRAYSLSSVPGTGDQTLRARITVKRVRGGLGSNHLADQLKAGEALRVFGPSGNFGLSPEEASGKHVILLGGGSGITPLRSLFEHLLTSSDARVTLIFGNRAERDIVFRTELDALAAAHPTRARVIYVLEDSGGAPGFVRGRLDKATSATLLEQALSGGPPAIFMSCGPTPMMAAVREALRDRGVPDSDIREEQFSSPETRKLAEVPSTEQALTIVGEGVEKTLTAAPGKTLLEAGLSAGVPMPFSCAMGGCGACKVKLRSGDVVSEEPSCLSAAEKRAGYVLACISRPASPCVVELPAKRAAGEGGAQ